MHIKDALPDGSVVPAGKGIGHLPELLRAYSAKGGEAVTLEPHLRVFDGLKDLITVGPSAPYPLWILSVNDLSNHPNVWWLYET